MSGHVSVMGDEAVAALGITPRSIHVDATFGAGGYSRRMIEAGARVVAFDRDPAALVVSKSEPFAGEGFELVHAPFGDMDQALLARGVEAVDGVVFDLGVSSMQLDQADRGFSFMRDGPLDMRMGQGETAADFVNEADEADIADVLYQYGDEKQSRRLAKAIVTDRANAPFETTGALAALAERVLGTREKIHPATRMFQAIRILVNDELGQVIRGLIASERLLRAGGRLVVVSFHSLEDRIVKRFVAKASGTADARSRHLPEAEATASTLMPVKRRATAPVQAEVAANRRARSAKMRIAERTDAPPRDWSEADLRSLGAPALVFSSLQRRWAA